MGARLMCAAALLLLVYAAPLGLSNKYLRSTTFETVTVEANDSVWSIAGRYTSDVRQAADLREAIVEINALDKEGHMYVGQVIRVPVLVQEGIWRAVPEVPASNRKQNAKKEAAH